MMNKLCDNFLVADIIYNYAEPRLSCKLGRNSLAAERITVSVEVPHLLFECLSTYC